MRVALILLFLLSLGAIPGSLIPQNSVDELKVADVQGRARPPSTPLYEKLQLFDVYSSVWFSAIYILLFVSLIGCIVPRTWQFVGQLRGRPPGAPRRLTRLPAYTTWRTDAEPEQVREAARAMLKKRRFRAHTVTATRSPPRRAICARPATSLFHIALIVMLVAFAAGQLFKSEGGKLIVEGDGFSNTLTQYDDFKSGSLFDTDDLAPFSFTLDNFDGDVRARAARSSGTPRDLPRPTSPTPRARTARSKKTVIEVNKPLDIDGTKVYLLAHGYAPVVTVKDGKGKVVYKGAGAPAAASTTTSPRPARSRCTDGYRDKNGKKDQLGFQAFFVPTFGGEGKGTMFSQFPALDYPVLALTAYHGSLGVDSGLPQNVYQLDTRKMKQFKDATGRPVEDGCCPARR